MRQILGLLAAAALGLSLAGCGGTADAEKEAAPAASINGGAPASPTKDVPGSSGKSDAKPAAAAVDEMHPVVVIETSLGSITVKLDKEKAPLTVENFLAYVARGHYDNTIFHQVLREYAILGGGFTADLNEKPTRSPVLNEAHNRRKNLRGTVGMVRLPDKVDSSTCQFFINVVDNPKLDHEGEGPEKYGYCIFGDVEPESMKVVDKIAAVGVTDKPNFERIPIENVIITSIHRVR